MTISILAAALVAQVLPAPGAVTWEQAAEDNGGRYAIDPASLVRDGDKVRFLMRANAAQAQADGTDMAVVRYVIDCRRRTAGIEASDFYRAGAFASSRETDADEMETWPIAEGSGEMRIYRRVCPAAGTAR